MAISLPVQKSALRERPLLGFKYTFSLGQMFIISVLKSLNIEHHHTLLKTTYYLVF